MQARRKKIVLLEAIHPGAKEALEAEGHHVELLAHSPSGEELDRVLSGASVVGIRSKTRLTAEVLARHPQIELIGCFCIGTDQVDTKKANAQGVPVFNAPHSNTRSVAELVIAEIVALSRQLGDRNSNAHKGVWTKSADGAHEVRGKTLGIVGYGHIGSQASVLAEAFGMRVVFYDVVKKLPMGNSQASASLSELLRVSDFVSLHVPDTAGTRLMIGAKQLELMKDGAALINASRGSVVDIEALANAIRAKKLSGAAIDVFPEEPASNKEKFESPLQGLPNVILTPHIGGSTLEAQESIGLEVAQSILKYLSRGTTSGAVNFPQVDLQFIAGSTDVPRRRIMNVHRNVPGVLGEINSIVSDLGANIQAQGLATDSQIGYLVMDVESVEADEFVARI
ncbi:MAG: phosphoglycerate dehydrogenase, partial [Bdellovibrionales bacterium]|nr:phosphoglycerate dehydrogenase [Bdellovibrionales bacterium]